MHLTFKAVVNDAGTGFLEAWQAIGCPMLRPNQGLHVDGKWTEAEKIES